MLQYFLALKITIAFFIIQYFSVQILDNLMYTNREKLIKIKSNNNNNTKSYKDFLLLQSSSEGGQEHPQDRNNHQGSSCENHTRISE